MFSLLNQYINNIMKILLLKIMSYSQGGIYVKKKTFKMVSLSLIVLLILAIVPAFAFAESSNHIYSNEIKAEPGSTISIPVYISKNSGFMGFALLFSYDESVMTPISASKGNLISSGLFDDSIGTSSDSEFKVIWSGTENITSDGEVCVLNFKTNGNANGKYKINVSYESKNVYDQNYKSVKLNCEDIVIDIGNGKTPEKQTFWQKITAWFEKVWNWIVGLFIR